MRCAIQCARAENPTMFGSETTMRAAAMSGSDPGPAHLKAFALASVAMLALAVGLHAADRRPALPTNAQVASTDTEPSGVRPRPLAQPVSSDALPHVQGKRITTMVVEFPPSGFSPPHHHGGSVTVYVLSGVIRSQLQGQPPMVYRAGESFFEPPGAVHLLAENMSATEPARILAVFVADEGATLTTYH
jgi:quercetin dioxygenase-like cupin family protein